MSESVPVSGMDVAFSETVKAIQGRKGSREAYANMAARDGWTGDLNEQVREFIESQESVYLGTVSADGQPYIQHRGGPPGFLRVLDERTIAFADFKGNRQFISQGNLADNPKAFLFLMDYRIQRRIKIWGEATVVEDDPDLLAQLMPDDYRAKPEQIIVFRVKLWDVNCRQHIPQRLGADEVDALLADKDARIAALENAVKRLGGDPTTVA